MNRNKLENSNDCSRLLKAAAQYTQMLKKVWCRLNGDAAYERYLEHWQEHHRGDGQAPLGRKAFFAAEMRRKWSGVKRCC
jgi:uncharacterized short protein YbdD (DUF466 family)